MTRHHINYPIIPGLFPDEYFEFALWSIGSGSFNCGSINWIVFHHTKTDYLVREASRFAGGQIKYLVSPLAGSLDSRAPIPRSIQPARGLTELVEHDKPQHALGHV